VGAGADSLLGSVSSAHSGGFVLALAVFLACAVEMVEAFTIVLAVGVTRGWRLALAGAGAAVVVLGALVAVVGPPIVHWVPLDVLRVIIGALLLWFGFGWLRKAVLRAAGRKAKHDEDAIYAKTVAGLEGEMKAAGSTRGEDRAAFLVSFKGVFLEGLEVVIIVLTLGGASHNLGLAAASAAVALVAVVAVAAVAARPLAKVPENTMKMAVGLMLVSFGTFWVAEGLGLKWPGSDAALLGLVALYGLVAWGAVRLLAGRSPSPSRPSA
jgi:uncharacterized membrane protein